MKLFKYVILTITLLLFFSGHLFAQPAIIADNAIFRPVQAKKGMVVTGEPIAARAALDVLKRGGNAVDAAVTAGFVMAVTLPQAGNIGGGGFMLVYSVKEKKVIAIDYREKAPKLAMRDMFLDKEGRADSEKSRFSRLSTGVPGTVAGLALALERYGTLTLKEALRPAIRLAEKGFLVSDELAADIKKSAGRLKRNRAAAKIFFKKDGSPYEPGERFVQKDLAGTLTRIAKRGVKGFYAGKTTEFITGEMARGGGLITKEDLAAYRPVLRKPVCGDYRGFEVCSMPPPSSGGVHIVQILNVLEGYDLASLGHNSAATIHLMAEAMKQAYADRSKYLGDPDFFNVPIKEITSKGYADNIRKKIALGRTRPSRDILPGKLPLYESDETTHFSVVDGWGNAVSNTYTINFSFGSGIVVEGAGFLLNNEMDDFSAKPGVPNAYGLMGGEANAVEPEKRMLSSMSPSIVLKGGTPRLVTGSPGGSRIISTTLQVILNVIDHSMNIQEAVNAPRIHHQWLPDEIRVERGVSRDTVKLLEGKGHKVTVKAAMGAAESILIDNEKGFIFGAADPRRDGLALGY